MIIFGWGYNLIKNFGPTFEYDCSNCNNKNYWVLQRVMTFFTLFFIPLIPYRIKYFLLCPICKYGLTLNSDQIAEIKPVAILNQNFIDKEISESDYKNEMHLLTSKVDDLPKSTVDEKIIPELSEVKTFCTYCGKDLKSESKFCASCGGKVLR